MLNTNHPSTAPLSSATPVSTANTSTNTVSKVGTQKVPDPQTPDRPAGTTGGGPTTTPAATPAGPPSASGAAAQLERWLNDLNEPNVPPASARRIIGDIEDMRPNLSGLRLAESHYVAMIAYAVLEDTEGACREARLVKRLHTDLRRTDAADAALSGCP